MDAKQKHILVAEDDKSVRLVVQQALARQGYTVHSSGNASGLWKLIEAGKGDILITDVALPDGDALDLLPRIKEKRPDLPVIVMSARSTLLTAVKAQQIGVFEYLPKPFELRNLVDVVARAFLVISGSSDAPTRDMLPQLEDGGPLVGRSRSMQDIFKAVARVVSTDLTVLITGESGTGKELVAKAVHDLGDRRQHPFVTVNLATIPHDKVDAELFGVENKSAIVSMINPGRFEQADGGTLFLDEVGDMPLETQTRLLRVLQDGTYVPSGSTIPVKSNVRIIAATNKNLQHLMDQGLFREDLFYRLNVVPLRLPPLRDRLEDITPLVNHFLAKSAENGLPSKVFSTDAKRLLKTWYWPGNVRELENMVHRLLVLHNEDVIDVDAVATELSQQDKAEEDQNESDNISQSVDAHIRRYFDALKGGLPAPGLHGRIMREVELPLITATLEITRGNQVKAADILGMNRNTLRKKIKELGITAGR
ncbi:nitrogen regulation protein NR(I) [Candidatus Puniceispirillum sp.]|jgi:two-component system, NtrC family, nitrogen regulation response regulator GlnG|uniref:nitrogen regulation protein NR(I) n=1 Tax=Candidatus Puniceispirillum sp. TaxID=2026719 RepID=UPI001EC46826|nr:nitrogen regulation protein NR(I) [Candidatus Puniceispirillum sp.]